MSYIDARCTITKPNGEVCGKPIGLHESHSLDPFCDSDMELVWTHRVRCWTVACDSGHEHATNEDLYGDDEKPEWPSPEWVMNLPHVTVWVQEQAPARPDRRNTMTAIDPELPTRLARVSWRSGPEEHEAVYVNDALHVFQVWHDEQVAADRERWSHSVAGTMAELVTEIDAALGRSDTYPLSEIPSHVAALSEEVAVLRELADRARYVVNEWDDPSPYDASTMRARLRSAVRAFDKAEQEKNDG